MTTPSYLVRLSQMVAGDLARDSRGVVGFKLRSQYLEAPLRPVLGQVFEDDPARVHWGRRDRELPIFFANLLPEGSLRSVLQRSLGCESLPDLVLLARLGCDLPGAIEVAEGETEHRMPDGTVEEDVQAIGASDELGLRFSLAGVQLKFSMVREGEVLTLPAQGRGGEWILKVEPSQFPGLVENEHTVLEWARAARFEVPECQVVESDSLGVLEKVLGSPARGLAVRRFDRTEQGRVHQEDFAQVFNCPPSPSELKYHYTAEQLLILARALLGEPGCAELLRRLVLVVASGNNDSHVKNWALTYPDGITPRLSPLYDQVSTVAWPVLDRKLALKLGGVRHFGEVSLDVFRKAARRVGLDEGWTAAVVCEAADHLRETWRSRSGEFTMLGPHRQALAQHWRRVPLLRHVGELEGRASAL